MKTSFIIASILFFSYTQFSYSIINGVKVEEKDWSEVVQIQTGNSKCSGTLIGPDVIITPSYCVNTDISAINIISLGSSYYADAVFHYKNPNDSLSEFSIIITQSTLMATPIKIAKKVKLNQTVEMVGFGSTSTTTTTTTFFLNKGTCEVVALKNDTFETENKTLATALNFGDSGAPAIFNKELLGIGTAGDIAKKSYFIRLDNRNVRKFLKKLAQEEFIEIYGITN